jgi:STE24 endopeptidase
MNPWLIAFLLITSLEFILEQSANLLNIKQLSPTVPAPFKQLYDQQEYARSQSYLLENTRLAILKRNLLTPLLLTCIVLGGFGKLDHLARTLSDNMILCGLIYTGLLAILSGLINLPFTLYSQFNIEERYGFNRTSWKTFITDLLKISLLSIIIGGPLLAAILWILDSLGAIAWLICWIAMICFQLVMIYLGPEVIMPLFNRFTPLEEGPLKELIKAYAREQNFKLDDVYTMDGSKRSSKANAFFTGFGKSRRVVLFDTLVNQHSDQECLAVLAHEVGHYKHRHIHKQFIAGTVSQGLMFWLMSICLTNPELYKTFGVSFEPINGSPPIYAGLVIFGLLYTPVSYLTQLVLNALSRRYEYQADEFAARTIGDPHSLVRALTTLTVNTLGNLTPHPLRVMLSYSHPPILRRIQALETLA